MSLGTAKAKDLHPNGPRDYNSHEDKNMQATNWTVAEAKAKFSAVIDEALAKGPQTITRNGRNTVVLVSFEEWERKTKRVGNLAEFFASSPLRGSELSFERFTDEPREIEL